MGIGGNFRASCREAVGNATHVEIGGGFVGFQRGSVRICRNPVGNLRECGGAAAGKRWGMGILLGQRRESGGRWGACGKTVGNFREPVRIGGDLWGSFGEAVWKRWKRREMRILWGVGGKAAGYGAPLGNWWEFAGFQRGPVGIVKILWGSGGQAV